MNSTPSKHENHSTTVRGVVYRTTCQNPGCGASFDLNITPQNAGMLSGSISCPRCKRHGGFLKPQGRIGDKLFAAKLFFRLTGIGPTARDDEDLFDGGDSRY